MEQQQSSSSDSFVSATGEAPQRQTASSASVEVPDTVDMKCLQAETDTISRENAPPRRLPSLNQNNSSYQQPQHEHGAAMFSSRKLIETSFSRGSVPFHIRGGFHHHMSHYWQSGSPPLGASRFMQHFAAPAIAIPTGLCLGPPPGFRPSSQFTHQLPKLATSSSVSSPSSASTCPAVAPLVRSGILTAGGNRPSMVDETAAHCEKPRSNSSENSFLISARQHAASLWRNPPDPMLMAHKSTSISCKGRPLSSSKHVPFSRKWDHSPLSPPTAISEGSSSQWTKLVVSNLDYNITSKDWKVILNDYFKTISNDVVINVHSVQPGHEGASNGSSGCHVHALVSLPSVMEARLAISHFHRKKVGYKRIQVHLLDTSLKGIGHCETCLMEAGNIAPRLYNQGRASINLNIAQLQPQTASSVSSFQNDLDQEELRLGQEVVQLLYSIQPHHTLPLCKFMQLFEHHFRHSLSLQQLYRFRGTLVEVGEFEANTLLNGVSATAGGGGGRFVRLLVDSPAVMGLLHPDSGLLKHLQLSGKLEKIIENDIPRLNQPTFCARHSSTGTDEVEALPRMYISLAEFRENIYRLLREHQGRVLICSLAKCYSATFGSAAFHPAEQHFEDMVYMEQLLMFVPGVSVVEATISMDPLAAPTRPRPGVSRQILQWSTEKFTVNKNQTDKESPEGEHLRGHLSGKVSQLCREVVDLVKHQPGCSLPMNKFIPAYHHHFGRQCRVADYGYSKLPELIEGALSSVCCVLGQQADSRIIVLSKATQLKRFAQEVLKVLRCQALRSCLSNEFGAHYERIFHHKFKPSDYGVCVLEDLLKELPENTVEMHMVPSSFQGTSLDPSCHQLLLLSMPRRMQTSHERERTIQFALETVELLRHFPRGRISFNKFIPAYHHHFGRQCRVADYGFVKLCELLEATPNVAQFNHPSGIVQEQVKIVDENGVKFVALTRHELLRMFATQTLTLLQSTAEVVFPLRQALPTAKAIPLEEFLTRFTQHHGHSVCLEDYQVKSVHELLTYIPTIATVVKAEETGKQPHAAVSSPSAVKPESQGSRCLWVCLAERSAVRILAHRVLLILLDVPSGSMSCDEFALKFQTMFHSESVDWRLLQNDLGSICTLQIEKSSTSSTSNSSSNGPPHVMALMWRVKLLPLIMFARDYRDLLRASNQNRLSLSSFESAYERHFGIGVMPQVYGYPTLLALLRAVDFVAIIKGHGVATMLHMYPDFLSTLTYRVAYDTEPRMLPTRPLHSPVSTCRTKPLQSTPSSAPHRGGTTTKPQQLCLPMPAFCAPPPPLPPPPAPASAHPEPPRMTTSLPAIPKVTEQMSQWPVVAEESFLSQQDLTDSFQHLYALTSPVRGDSASFQESLDELVEKLTFGHLLHSQQQQTPQQQQQISGGDSGQSLPLQLMNDSEPLLTAGLDFNLVQSNNSNNFMEPGASMEMMQEGTPLRQMLTALLGGSAMGCWQPPVSTVGPDTLVTSADGEDLKSALRLLMNNQLEKSVLDAAFM